MPNLVYYQLYRSVRQRYGEPTVSARFPYAPYGGPNKENSQGKDFEGFNPGFKLKQIQIKQHKILDFIIKFEFPGFSLLGEKFGVF